MHSAYHPDYSGIRAESFCILVHLDYSQLLDDSAQLNAFSENSVLRVKIQSALLHKSKRGSLENF
jgi:hypothetical protein